MATITSASSGNFSAPATWIGGVVPGPADNAVAATTHVVTIDVDVTVISFQQAGTGKFTLGNGRAITGNVIGNAGTYTSGGTIEVTATTSATINGNISITTTSAVSIAAVVMNGTGSLTINGNINGSSSSGTDQAVVYLNANCTATVNGNINGGPGSFSMGIQSSAASTVTLNITGNLSNPGINLSSIPVRTSGNANVTVLGNITGGNNTNSGSGLQFLNNTTQSVTVTGNVTGGGTNARGIEMEGTSATANITGTIRGGGSTSNSWGIRLTGSGSSITVTGTLIARGREAVSIAGTSVNIVGNVIGGTSATPALLCSGTNVVAQVTGIIYGGSLADAYGVRMSGTASTLTVIGSAIARPALAHAVRSDATSNGVIFQGDSTDALDGTVAIWGRIFRMTATPSGVTKYASGRNYPFGTLVSRVPATNATGIPAINNVRLNTVYGATNQFTGTVAIPSASQVMYGVPVDGSTGTAEFDLQTVAGIIEAQVSAGAYERTTI